MHVWYVIARDYHTQLHYNQMWLGPRNDRAVGNIVDNNGHIIRETRWIYMQMGLHSPVLSDTCMRVHAHVRHMHVHPRARVLGTT